MWVQHTEVVSGDTNTTAVSYRHDDHTNGEYVRFGGSGKAQVTKDVGESMIEHYDAVEAVDGDGGNGDSDDGDGDTDPEFFVGESDGDGETDNE